MISAKDVKKLRDMTGAGMMDCKKALTETEGDIEKAIDLLRAKGAAKAAKRADRDAGEGLVFARGSDGVVTSHPAAEPGRCGNLDVGDGVSEVQKRDRVRRLTDACTGLQGFLVF